MRLSPNFNLVTKPIPCVDRSLLSNTQDDNVNLINITYLMYIIRQNFFDYKSAVCYTYGGFLLFIIN